MKFYMVGGAVRDEILGTLSKDIDFTCVMDKVDARTLSEDPSCTAFELMEAFLEGYGFEVFQKTPAFFTIRAKVPKRWANSFRAIPDSRNLTADFVLARKESGYSDGRHPDEVEVGTLYDDLARRDFTMNAIAKDSDGNLIDPFDGMSDISNRRIVCVGNPEDRFQEDALRVLRALRFSITKEFQLAPSIIRALYLDETMEALDKIHPNRMLDELTKMFRHDSLRAMFLLSSYPAIANIVMSRGVSLDPTLKIRGRNKNNN